MSPGAAAALQLPSVTLVCVDTATPALGLAAVQRCLGAARFAEALFFTRPDVLLPLPDGVRQVAVQIDSVPAYSQFMLKGLLAHVRTAHVLIVQWDGWLSDATAWTDDFLRCDYIGAPWNDQPEATAVGNGGFSLRSRRLLEALADPALRAEHPEDRCICITHREALEGCHGLRFAPLPLARRFAIEHEAPQAGPTLGFHGIFNLHRVLSDSELAATLEALPPAQCWGLGGRMLLRGLLRAGRHDAAVHLLNRARSAAPLLRWWRYRVRCAWQRARDGLGALLGQGQVNGGEPAGPPH